MIAKFYFAVAVITAAACALADAQQTEKVTPSGIGYLEYLPGGYHSNANKYPVVISLHGIKEKGTNSTDRNAVLADLEKVDNVGLPKYVKYGKQYPFILISPQLKYKYATWSPAFIIEVLNYVKKTLRVDERRIYLTGLSLGGWGVWKTAGEYPQVFAAIVPICPGGNALDRADELAAANVGAWGFHGSSDNVVSYTVTTRMINAMNTAPKKPNPLAKATIFPGMGHGVWDRTYNETNALEWMLSFRKGSAPAPTNNEGDTPPAEEENKTNLAPVADAGPDKTLTLPANSVDIQASAKDDDGKITGYRWTKVSGGTANLGAANASKLHVDGLVAGSYVFRVTVTDDDGATKSDEMKLVVNPEEKKNEAPPEKQPEADNSLPFVNSGPDRVLTLPENAITVQGTATDKDGKIVSYKWEKTYGGRASLSGETTPSVYIFNLDAGEYIFRLRATDDAGGMKEDYFKITVLKAEQPPQETPAPAEENPAPPAGENPAPPAGENPTPPAGENPKPPAGENPTPPPGENPTPPAEENPAPPAGENPAPPAEENPAPPGEGDPAPPAEEHPEPPVEENVPEVHRPNTLPVVTVGPDRVIQLPMNAISIQAEASDQDGRIVSYEWTKVYGRGGSLEAAHTSRVTLYGLSAGRYVLRLRVTDNDGGTQLDELEITVKSDGKKVARLRPGSERARTTGG